MIHPSPSGHVSGPYTRRGDFIDDLNEAIRHNPVPAALIGAGLFWMFMGGARNTVLGGVSRSLFSGMAEGAQQTGAAAYRGAREVGAKVADSASAIVETAEEAGSQAVDAMRSAAGALSGAANQAGSLATQTAKAAHDAAGNMIGSADQAMPGRGSVGYKGFQSALAGAFEKQPLLLGAIGLAVGSAIAASLPASNLENRLMGDAADSLKDKAQELWSEAGKRAETMASKGLEEAKAQGLTPETAGQALRQVADKAAGVMEAAKEAVSSRIKGEGAGNLGGPA
jgi:hypothetical protein